jgi:branched-subunit amino acid aminotransferase/4-amino-4-deoxychorismate lyase
MPQYISIDGVIQTEDKAHISPLNPGFLFGEGLFETVRADTGEPFLLSEHIARMRAGLKILQLEPPADFDLIPSAVKKLLTTNQLVQGAAIIKLICSQNHPISPKIDSTASTTLIIKTTRLELKEINQRQQGLRAQIIPWRRNRNNPLLGLKSLNYLENRYALQKTRCQGFDEGIFLNQEGELCEGTFSNLFLVRKGTLLTPPLKAGILPGITRAFILKKAHSAGIKYRETKLFPNDLKSCEGAFLTSSLMHLAPLIELDQNKFDPSQTAPLRKLLLSHFPRITA